MAGNNYQPYTRRQTMIRKDFEIYRYRSSYLNEVELHHHDFYEVYLLLRGEVAYTVENHIYNMRPGDLMLVSPLELHQARIKPDGDAYERIVLWIDRGYLENLSSPRTSLTRCFDTTVPGHTNLLRLPGTHSAEIRRVLKDGGLLIAPTFTHAENSFSGKVRAFFMKLAGLPLHSRWTSEEYLRFLRQNGWTVRKSAVLKASFPLTYAECEKTEV